MFLVIHVRFLPSILVRHMFLVIHVPSWASRMILAGVLFLPRSTTSPPTGISANDGHVSGRYGRKGNTHTHNFAAKRTFAKLLTART